MRFATRSTGLCLVLITILLADTAIAQTPGPWQGDPCGYFRAQNARGRCTPEGRWRVAAGGNTFNVYNVNGSSQIVRGARAQANGAIYADPEEAERAARAVDEAIDAAADAAPPW
ncbi:hypothetical protein IP88_02015 [alpha proteobacterium AAP81b]|nr:hypothetical protein IP88_02015 [alpha proteobacterium AAP81b]